jgi:hypothetical protein
MIYKKLVGILVGAIAGWLLGYLGACSGAGG